MVDKNYAYTTIKQDLLEIDVAYADISEDKVSKLPVVSNIPQKPGLNDINGKYIISGGVTLGKITTRKTTKSKVGEIVGYRVDRLECDDDGNVIYNSKNEPTVVETKLVTKQEGLHLVQIMGAQNAYIRVVERKKHAQDGSVIQTKTTAHLQPYPPKSQAFLQDGRVVSAYKVDEYGDRVVPVDLSVTEDDCSLNLWKMIHADYIGKRKRQKTRKSATDVKREQEEKLRQLRKSLVLQKRSFVNPFSNE